MRNLIKIILIILNLFVGGILLLCYLSSFVNSYAHPTVAIPSMTLPLWIPLALCLIIFDFFFFRKGCLILGCVLAVSFPAIATIFPLNISPSIHYNGTTDKSFANNNWTLLSYNVYNFQDITRQYPGGINPAVHYIIDTDADVVVLPEGRWLTPVQAFHLGQNQLDSLKRQYPYIIVGRDISLLSKFPAEVVKLDHFPNQSYKGTLSQSKIGGFKLNIQGEEVLLLGCHLMSLGLTKVDKNVYEDITRGEGLTSRREISEIKNDIITKISLANRYRAESINALVEDIKDFDFHNIIMCGDFNDTPLCYSIRQMEKIGLREVYPLVGNGYMNTYNSDRLLFQIDHVLFKGCFRPYSMKRGNQKSSDHYPLITTFIKKS